MDSTSLKSGGRAIRVFVGIIVILILCESFAGNERRAQSFLDLFKTLPVGVATGVVLHLLSTQIRWQLFRALRSRHGLFDLVCHVMWAEVTTLAVAVVLLHVTNVASSARSVSFA